MSKPPIRLLTLVITTALAGAVTVAPAESGARPGKHIKVHRPTRPAWPGAGPPAQSGGVCPAMARSFDCKIWPPPIDEDPDRKVSGSDGA
jgi:hypothetical protein